VIVSSSCSQLLGFLTIIFTTCVCTGTNRLGFTVWTANFYTGADSPEGVDEPRDDKADPEDDFCQEVALGEDG
jgi:hypothetical protein